jgi:hypothetical protein
MQPTPVVLNYHMYTVPSQISIDVWLSWVNTLLPCIIANISLLKYLPCAILLYCVLLLSPCPDSVH